MKSDLVDLELVLLRETAAAVYVSPDGTTSKATWLPKSQVETHYTGTGRTYQVTLPEWLATEKGLV